MIFRSVNNRPFVIIGAGGHAKVLHALLLEAGYSIQGICDPRLVQLGQTFWREIPVLGTDDALLKMNPESVYLVNGIGQLVGSSMRKDLYERVQEWGFTFPALVHPGAWVAPSVELAAGVQVMAGAVVQPDCRIEENTILNTRSSVDHDCEIGKHVHIAPGAILCGGVFVGDNAFIGSGATVIQGLHVGRDAVVGAGATLVRDLKAGCKILGAATRKYTSVEPII